MQQSIKNYIYSILACIVLVSCNKGETLQTYFVDNQEALNFVSADLPTSIITFSDNALTKEQQEAYKSIEKLNFLGFKIEDSTNLDAYHTEISKVKTILNDKKYNDLMEFNNRDGHVVLKYLGEDNNIDEFVVFGSSKDLGFGIVRVLGDNMSPEKIVALAEAIKNGDIDKSKLNGIKEFFTNIE